MMKISDVVKEKMFGHEVTYRLYEPQEGSKNVLIMLHGIGEQGPTDGSQLNEVEKNLGYPKLAASGFDFPFNIVAVQTDVPGYSVEKKCLAPYMKLKYGGKIIVTGNSMGGIGTYEMVLEDKLNVIDAIAPVCGKLNSSYAIRYPNIPIFALHGDMDTTVSLASDKAFIDAYNSIESHTIKAKLRIYAGVAHNAWDFAYRLDEGHDELYQWIIIQFLK